MTWLLALPVILLVGGATAVASPAASPYGLRQKRSGGASC